MWPGRRNGQGVKGIEEGSNSGRFQEREGEEFPGKKNLTRWSHLSARKKRKRKRKREEGGCGMRPAGLVPSRAGSAGLGPGSAQVGWPLPFFFFFCSDSFSIFCFSLFFISFAFWLQTDSNNFVNFSKIQSIKVGQ
jgi:hypothetical protein